MFGTDFSKQVIIILEAILVDTAKKAAGMSVFKPVIDAVVKPVQEILKDKIPEQLADKLPILALAVSLTLLEKNGYCLKSVLASEKSDDLAQKIVDDMKKLTPEQLVEVSKKAQKILGSKKVEEASAENALDARLRSFI